MPSLVALLMLTQPAAWRPGDASDDLFQPEGPILTVRVKVDKAELEKLRKSDREYVSANISDGTTSLKNVGMHLKGAAGSRRDWDDKPALTFNSDKFKSKQLFHGLDKFHLNNSVQDDTYLNEIISGELFRAAGVPMPRATHVFVMLNGRKAGLYLLKEGFDREFLSRHFKNPNGNLYDGGFLTDIYQPLRLSTGPGCDHQDLKALNASVRVERPQRLDAVSQKLDLDKFVSLWVIEVLCGDWDGYARNRNNYRLYCDPARDKFVFLAHGKDQLFQHAQDPVVHGWQGLVANSLWKLPEFRQRYAERMKAILALHFRYDDLAKRIDDWSQRLKDLLNAEREGWGDEYLRTVKQYKARVKERIAFLDREVSKLKP